MCPAPQSVDSFGAYALGPVLGQGGMGVVYEAVHRPTGKTVAIKAVLAKHADRPGLIESIRAEGRAAGGLNHPNILRVFDYGVIPPGQELAAGVPYLVMELAQGRWRPEGGHVDWARLRRLLIAVLSALAHSHAHGVVHLDVKGGNILLGLDGRPKLTDFGISKLQSDNVEEMSDVPGGTPSIMAPEQIERKWRDLGPWTDLYSVGCLGWQLATGRAPFSHHKGMVDVLRAHLFEELPAFRTQFQCPDAYLGWLTHLLAKDASARPQSAADALFTLNEMPDAVHRSEVAWAPRPSQQTTRILTEADLVAAPAPAPAAFSPQPRIPVRRPPERPALAIPAGLGMGLMGLRAPPLTGRTDILDVLWGHLASLYTSKESRAVLLKGPTGVGTSRLGQWLCQAALEAGAAQVLRAVHAPVPASTSGMAAAIGRWLVTDHLNPHAARARVHEMRGRWNPALNDEEVRVLADMGRSDSDLWDGNPRQRWAAFARLLTRTADTRPVLLWLDDPQWGPDAVGLANWLLEQTSTPILILATLSTDASPISLAQDRLGQLASHKQCHEIEVPPLGIVDTRILVSALMGVEDATSVEVAKHAEGQPLTVIAILEDWVSRGLLVPSASGWVSSTGRSIDTSDPLLEVWTRRLQAVCGDDEAAVMATEMAAMLGAEIDPAEWVEACACGDIDVDRDLLERLHASGIAVASSRGRWTFAHRVIGEALVRQAAARGRLGHHHRACVEMLVHREAPSFEERERLGVHLSYADPDRGWEVLVQLSNDMARALDAGGLSVVVRHLERIAVDFEDSDSRCGSLLMAQAILRVGSSDVAGGIELFEAAVSDARRFEWPLLPLALARTAHTLVQSGYPERALAYTGEAIRLGFKTGGCRISRSRALRELGRLDEARSELDEAVVSLLPLEDTNSKVTLSRAFRARANVETQAGSLEAAESFAMRAFEVARDLPPQFRKLASGPIYAQLARIAEARRKYAAALKWLDREAESSKGYATRNYLSIALNQRARALIGLERWSEARDAVVAAMSLPGERTPSVSREMQLLNLWCHAHFKAWEELSTQIRGLSERGETFDEPTHVEWVRSMEEATTAADRFDLTVRLRELVI